MMRSSIFRNNDQLVSVIVPVYNAEKYLSRCVESIIQQDYTNLEIILVNDGSKDESLLLCDHYAGMDDRIKVVNKINGGAASARNAGLEIATGNYVLFVDSDDEIKPNHVSGLYVYHDADIVSTSLELDGWGGKYIKADVISSGDDAVSLCEFYSSIDILATGSVCNKLFRKKLIDNQKIRFLESLKDTAEDLIFTWSYLICCSSYHHIDNRTYVYKENESSITHECFDKDTYLYIDKRIKLFDQLITTLEPLKNINMFVNVIGSTHNYFFNNIIRTAYIYGKTDPSKRKEILSCYKKLVKRGGYKPWNFSTGVFNKLATIGIISGDCIGDLLLRGLVNARKNIGRIFY